MRTNNLHLRKSWEKQTLYHIPVSPIGEIYVLTEFNVNYGHLITQFQINGENLTNVESRYSHVGTEVGNKWILPFHACDALLGVRPFDKGSITYEFLFKPLGIIAQPFGDTVLCLWHHLQDWLDDHQLKYNRK